MELGAVVVVPANREAASKAMLPVASDPSLAKIEPLYSARSPILGNDVVQLWMDRVRGLGIGGLWLASDSGDRKLMRSRFADLTRQGIDKFLVIKLKSYAEMDLSDLLRFHCEKQNPVTNVQDSHGPLGVSLVNCSAFDSPDGDQSANCFEVTDHVLPYEFRGYTKRLLSSRQRHDLILDALNGNCAMRPAGHQRADQVWIADTAVVDPSARVIGPAFIGNRSVIHGGVTIGPFASIEHDCVIDFAATVERSSVLPCTYLAAGAFIRNSVVNGERLENLTWEAIVDLASAGLGRRIPKSSFLKRNPFRRFTTSDEARWRNDSPFYLSPACEWIRVKL